MYYIIYTIQGAATPPKRNIYIHMVALVVLHLAAHGLVLPPPRLLSNLAIPGRTGLEVPVTADVSV